LRTYGHPTCTSAGGGPRRDSGRTVPPRGPRRTWPTLPRSFGIYGTYGTGYVRAVLQELVIRKNFWLADFPGPPPSFVDTLRTPTQVFGQLARSGSCGTARVVRPIRTKQKPRRQRPATTGWGGGPERGGPSNPPHPRHESRHRTAAHHPGPPAQSPGPSRAPGSPPGISRWQRLVDRMVEKNAPRPVSWQTLDGHLQEARRRPVPYTSPE